MALTVIWGPEWQKAIEALRLVDESAARRIQAAVREEVEAVVVPDVKAHALAIPAHGPKHTGLRAGLAEGVNVSGGAGSTTDIKATGFLSGGEDNGPAGWRHPVYGHMNTWVHQDGTKWFKSVIEGHDDGIERKLASLLESMANEIG